MRLRHFHLPGLTRYAEAASLQEQLVRSFLFHKAARAPSHSSPEPAVLTAEFHPVYTCGRREVSTVSEEQQDYLKDNGRADFFAALRGGQTTFHGPGQLVAYPILDLKQHDLNPRAYVCLLEQTVINTCASYGVDGFRTNHPGVWTSQDDKICALGVHLRRNITSHGIGLNVSNTPLPWFGRIVACGLEGKRTTSLERQQVFSDVTHVAHAFVEHLRQGLRLPETLSSDVDSIS